MPPELQSAADTALGAAAAYCGCTTAAEAADALERARIGVSNEATTARLCPRCQHDVSCIAATPPTGESDAVCAMCAAASSGGLAQHDLEHGLGRADGASAVTVLRRRPTASALDGRDVAAWLRRGVPAARRTTGADRLPSFDVASSRAHGERFWHLAYSSDAGQGKLDVQRVMQARRYTRYNPAIPASGGTCVSVHLDAVIEAESNSGDFSSPGHVATDVYARSLVLVTPEELPTASAVAASAAAASAASAVAASTSDRARARDGASKRRRTAAREGPNARPAPHKAATEQRGAHTPATASFDEGRPRYTTAQEAQLRKVPRAERGTKFHMDDAGAYNVLASDAACPDVVCATWVFVPPWLLARAMAEVCRTL